MTIPQQDTRSKRAKTIAIFLWTVATIGLGVSLFPNLKSVAPIGGIAGVVFVIAFIWYLSGTGTSAKELPAQESLVLPRLGFWGMIGIIIVVVGVLSVIGMAMGPAFVMIVVSAFVALWIIVIQRYQVHRQLIVWGLVAGIATGIAIKYLGNGDLSWAVFNLVTTPILFIGGALLRNRTKLGHIRVLEEQYRVGLKGFLWACVLALPFALLNLLGNVQASDVWVTHWWQPFSALAAGIAEEVWARLFLTTFCYALLRPTTNERPRRALIAAVLIGALIHGLAHTGFNPIAVVIGSLLYSIPPAVLFIKRDLEHAVGYHFLIDFVRFTAALLQS